MASPRAPNPIGKEFTMSNDPLTLCICEGAPGEISFEVYGGKPMYDNLLRSLQVVPSDHLDTGRAGTGTFESWESAVEPGAEGADCMCFDECAHPSLDAAVAHVLGTLSTDVDLGSVLIEADVLPVDLRDRLVSEVRSYPAHLGTPLAVEEQESPVRAQPRPARR